ncbi:MAG TPA: hypothetical protein VN310_17895 [Candidatus Dormibacteraeota bacterium]|nr:hypothetical protein [Candidatus Dormibacteraeota bacterium]
MKNLRIIFPLLMTLLFASVALAQAGKRDLPDAPQPQASAPAQSDNTQDANAGASADNTLISQAGRYPRLPRRPVRAPRGYGYRPAAPMPGLSPAGALIGFGVGFGLGASASQDGSANARVASGLIVGAIGALIGGAIGAVPHVRRRYPPSDPDDDDDSDLRSDGRSPHPKQPVSAKTAAPAQSTGVEATAQTSPEEPAVP